MILSLAWKELRFARSSAKLRLVIVILALGFIGPFFASSLKTSIAGYLETSSRTILSADLTINDLRPLEARERAWIDSHLKPVRAVEETEFVTMAKGRDVATLVEVKAVEPTFPIYGSFKFAPSENRPPASDASKLDESARAWAFPEALAQLGLKPGDRIGIGSREFVIDAILEDAPGLSRSGGFAPRIFIGRKFVEETGLTQYGSQIYHRLYLKLPSRLDPEDAAQWVRAEIEDPNLFVRTPDDAISGFERFFQFFNVYLIAITMIVFILSWVSAFYILQVFLGEKLKNAAIVMINGGSRLRAGLLSGLQVVFVMAGAFALAGLLTAGLEQVANVLLATRLPEGFRLAMDAHDLGRLAVIAAASAIAFNVPFWLTIARTPLKTLLDESGATPSRRSWALRLASDAPLLALFFLVSAWLMESWLDAARLAGSMAIAGAVGLALGRLLFGSLFRAVRARAGSLRLIATSLARARFGVNLCFLALVLIALSMNLVPHLLRSVVEEVQPLEGKEVPQLFLFNIPESQLEKLKSFASARAVELRYLSPLVLARLLKVNGHETDNDQFARFPVRLSYRDARIPSETLVAGRDLPKHYDPASGSDPEISVESKFAARNGFHLGDTLEFDVQSIPIRAKITSLRHVQWTSFNPNFFIMFEPGVLDDAPKTWIADVNFGGGEAQKVRLQYELTRDFPDLSIIDIGRTINRVLEVARSVITPVTWAALIAVAIGFAILIGVIAHNLRLRDPEIDIEKLFGADERLIRGLLTGEYAILAFGAWFVGASAAGLIAWLVTRQALDVPLLLSWNAIAISFAAVVLVTTAIAFASADRVLRLRGASRRL